MEVMRSRIGVMDYRMTENGYAWVENRKIWGAVERVYQRAPFSNYAVYAARSAEVVTAAGVCWEEGMCIDGEYGMISKIVPQGHFKQKITVVFLPLRHCFTVGASGKVRFQAVMGEKYVRHEQREPMAVNVAAYVLITPKVMCLQAGKIVEVEGESYVVLAEHTAGEVRNEYEIAKTKDL